MEGFICIGELQDIISRIVKTSDEANIQKYIFGAFTVFLGLFALLGLKIKKKKKMNRTYLFWIKRL